MVEVIPAGTPASGDKKLVFKYDYLNRRVEKLVYAWDPNQGDNGDWATTASLDRRFMYHDRLLLLELDGLDSNARVRKYAWGAGTDGKLGGENSLLAIRDVDADTNYICFNNGSGSVAQLLDRSDGSLDAAYVYDTRGDTVRESGSYAADNPLRYKTWHCDDEFNYSGTDCDCIYSAFNQAYYSPRFASTFGAIYLGVYDTAALYASVAPLYEDPGSVSSHSHMHASPSQLPPVTIDDYTFTVSFFTVCECTNCAEDVNVATHLLHIEHPDYNIGCSVAWIRHVLDNDLNNQRDDAPGECSHHCTMVGPSVVSHNYTNISPLGVSSSLKEDDGHATSCSDYFERSGTEDVAPMGTQPFGGGASGVSGADDLAGGRGLGES